MSQLALFGGTKVRNRPFPAHKPVGEEETAAVADVMNKGVLSKFLGAWHDDFYGGPMVNRLEKAWSEHFGSKHSISVNSNTSGIICAMGAIGITPGDEVIVCGYSMSISAVAPLFYGGVPVFADLEPELFCLDPEEIEKKITKKTKAIIVVDLFGQVHNADAINKIAKKYNLNNI